MLGFFKDPQMFSCAAKEAWGCLKIDPWRHMSNREIWNCVGIRVLTRGQGASMDSNRRGRKRDSHYYFDTEEPA